MSEEATSNSLPVVFILSSGVLLISMVGAIATTQKRLNISSLFFLRHGPQGRSALSCINSLSGSQVEMVGAAVSSQMWVFLFSRQGESRAHFCDYSCSLFSENIHLSALTGILDSWREIPGGRRQNLVNTLLLACWPSC